MVEVPTNWLIARKILSSYYTRGVFLTHTGLTRNVLPLPIYLLLFYQEQFLIFAWVFTLKTRGEMGRSFFLVPKN